MPKFACPICGDPNAFPIWIDDRPPLGCPHDEAWMEGAAPKVRSVTDCAYQRQKAWQAREFRRLGPECFDDRGNLKPGPETLARVVRAFHAAHPSRPLVIWLAPYRPPRGLDHPAFVWLPPCRKRLEHPEDYR